MNDQERRRVLAQFLRTRRERVTPEQVGLPSTGRRRVKGLRREELATLAGIGVDWYTQLEKGNDITVSTQVVESLAQALGLSAEERNHLYVLARGQFPADPYPLTDIIRPALQTMEIGRKHHDKQERETGTSYHARRGRSRPSAPRISKTPVRGTNKRGAGNPAGTIFTRSSFMGAK
ncbi:hypothetical protein KSX_88770 [Ktedonospora formicarum]|uniref:HTH cro/C1-type domain-containing protein n=1 Tax=Ktedonospora formicarum TaxID=2778364 RepID=A0A8J3I6Z9_9CHLR|nr:helix-turn-helix transcriptional regulator [Ktedonospora formicarum]GHO50714.1 hypothetical protein KSX_88770 [Ktedonospora formicarum]